MALTGCELTNQSANDSGFSKAITIKNPQMGFAGIKNGKVEVGVSNLEPVKASLIEKTMASLAPIISGFQVYADTENMVLGQTVASLPLNIKRIKVLD